MERLRHTSPVFQIAIGCFALLPALSLATASSARSFRTVSVEGEKFLNEADILATCGVSAGVDYSGKDLATIEGCLRATEMFKNVTLVPGTDDLVIEVEEIEMRPGRLELSLAYDSQDGPVGSLYFERYNLFPDTFGALELRLAGEMQELNSSLYYTGFGPGRADIGLDGLMRHTEYDDQSFDSDRAQIEMYLARVLNEKTRFEIGLGQRHDEVSSVDASASALIRADDGSVTAPYLRFSYAYDSGRVTGPELTLRFDQYFWGLGSDNRLSDSRLSGETRVALGEETKLIAGVRAGALQGLGGTRSRVVDRYQLGGVDFRGFAPRGIGPKDGADFLGGNAYMVGSLEVQHSVGEIWHTPTRIGAFVDFGSVWSLDDTLGGSIDDAAHLRSAAGLTMTFDIGGAPLSLYLATALAKEDGDDTQSFGLSFSTRF